MKKDKIETTWAGIIEDKIIFTLDAYSGQVGLIGVWDVVNNKLIHLTNEEYIYKVALFDDKIMSIKRIGYWGHPVSYDLDEIELGIIDYEKSSRNLKKDIDIKDKRGRIKFEYEGKTIIFDGY